MRQYALTRSSSAASSNVRTLNVKGRLTETTRANLVLELGGALYTPPLECGLLPGVQREIALQRGEVTERVLTVADLRVASRIALLNGVRGWYEGRLG